MSTSYSRPKGSVTVRHGHRSHKDSAAISARNTLISQGFIRWATKRWKQELPGEWQPVLGDFPEHLQAIGLSSTHSAKILPLALRFIALLRQPPCSVTKDDLAAAMLKQPSHAGSLSYIVLCMISRGHWPKSYLRQRAQITAIEKYLAPEWASFSARLQKDLDSLNVPYNAQHYFKRCAVIFIWWTGLPASGAIEESKLRGEWDKFWRDRPEAAGGIFPKITWSPERCYAAIWNCLLKDGRVRGTPRKFVLAAPPFWKTIVEPVRGAAHRLLGSGTRPGDSEIRRHRLLYALTLMGFCTHGKQRASEVPPEEWRRLEEVMRREGFLKASVAMVLEDAREVLALAKSGALREEASSNGD